MNRIKDTAVTLKVQWCGAKLNKLCENKAKQKDITGTEKCLLFALGRIGGEGSICSGIITTES